MDATRMRAIILKIEDYDFVCNFVRKMEWILARRSLLAYCRSID